MTDPTRPEHKISGPARRALHPDGGAILRRTYARLLAVSVAAVIFAWIIVATFAGDSTGSLLALASIVLGIASVCLPSSIIRGRTAVDGDHIEVPALRTASLVARIGSLVSWLGALAIAATGFVLNTQDADQALLRGIVLGAMALILGILLDSSRRIAKRLITG